MRKLLILLILISISFTSCIEIVEEIKVNADKSGSVSWKIDLGLITTFSKMLMNEETSNMLDGIEKFPAEGVKSLSKIKGLSNISIIPDSKEKGVYGLNFDFQNTKSLNQAYYQMTKVTKKWYYPSLVKVKKRKFKRKDLGPLIKRLNIELPSEIDEKALSMIKIKSIVHLPREVKKNKNSAALNSESKSITQEFILSDLISGSVDTGNKIRF